MSARDTPLETPRRLPSSSSSSKKRSRNEEDKHEEKIQSKKDRQTVGSVQQAVVCVSPPSVVGPSNVNTGTADRPAVATADQLDRLSAVVNSLGVGAHLPDESELLFGGSHDLSASEVEDLPEPTQCASADPLEDLDMFDSSPVTDPNPADDTDFLKALEDLSSHFHGEEEKGDPLSDCLASILNASLRRKPTAEGIRNTCSKIKLPRNVPNMTVPVTNPAISKALSVGGKLIDARLSHTNSLLSKALVPVAVCISDIGEKNGKSVSCYLDGLNNSLRLLTSAFNYLNNLPKEVARIHVDDFASKNVRSGSRISFPLTSPSIVMKYTRQGGLDDLLSALIGQLDQGSLWHIDMHQGDPTTHNLQDLGTPVLF